MAVPSTLDRMGTLAVSSSRLVGRDEELGRLRTALEGAVNGRFAAVVVGGEAGVGKTRLVEELCRHVDSGETLVAVGRCVELGGSNLPFTPLSQALRELHRTLGDDRLRHLLRGPREDLQRLVPGFGARGGDEGAVPESGRMFEAVVSLLDVLSEQQPVLLVLEDLHWADQSTLDLLRVLVGMLHGARCLLVATYRSDELHRRHPLRPALAELTRVPDVERLELDPLGAEDIEALVRELVASGPAEDMASEIAGRVGGNPFYAEELALWMDREGSDEIPPTLRDVLTSRLDDLSPPARRVLRAAAAIGRDVDHRLLEEVVELPPDELEQALREARSRRIVRASHEDRTIRFRHALVQEVVHDELLPREHTRLHRTIAAALEDAPQLAQTGPGGVDAELAHHYYAAHDLDSAFRASLAAARAAAHVHANAEALQHFERALRLWDRAAPDARRAAPPRWEVLRDASWAAALIGDARRAVELLRAALDDTGDLPAATRAVLLAELGHKLWKQGHAEESLRMSEEAVEVVPTDQPTAELAEVLGRHGGRLMLLGRFDEAVELARRAIDVSRQVDAPLLEADALASLGPALASQGATAEGVARLEDALRIGKELDHAWTVGRAYVNLTHVLDMSDRGAEAAARGLEGLAWLDAAGASGATLEFLRLNVIDELLWQGRWVEADEQVAALSGAYLRTENVVGLHHAMTVGQLRALQGRVEEASTLLARGRALLQTVTEPQFLLPFAAADLELAVSRREREAVLASARRLSQIEPDIQDRHVRAALLARAAAILAVDLASDRPDAAPETAHAWAADAMEQLRYRLEDPPGDTVVQRRMRAGLARAEAELTRTGDEPDPGAWRAALETRGPDAPHELARLRYRLSEAILGAEGDREVAARELEQAHQTARELGAGPLRASIEDLARRARIPLPGMSPEDTATAAGLTPREHEVLQLLVEGRTNREIGEALFIATKTASVHVSNILRKLGVDSRYEAAAFAREHGLAEA